MWPELRHDKAFDVLRHKIITLDSPDCKKTFVIEADASSQKLSKVVAAVLSQRDEVKGQPMFHLAPHLGGKPPLPLTSVSLMLGSP